MRVSAGVDVKSATATWLLQAIDPQTGEVIQDTTKGLLPPDDAQGHGLGTVGYTIKPKADLATGVTIKAQARVVFNTLAPQDTLELTQTIDAAAPVTTLTATAIQAGAAILILASPGVRACQWTPTWLG